MKKMFVALFLALSLNTPVQAQDKHDDWTIIPEVETNMSEDLPLLSSKQVYDDISSWCQDRVLILRSSLRQARFYSNQYNFSLAVKTLKQGLSRAKTSHTMYNSALTYRAIVRTIEITKNLESTMGSSDKKQRVLNHFLERSYAFIMSVANDLDPISYRPNCGYCRPSDMIDLEAKFLEFSQAQVQVALDSMFAWNSELVIPIGGAPAALSTLRTSLKYHLYDLEKSLWSEYYACSILRLRDLILNLQTSPLPEVAMVQYAYNETVQVLSDSRGCGYHYGGY